MLSAPHIRESFLSFFQSKNHLRLPSSSLVPQGDPSLLFTNAGMVQFKDVFTGQERPLAPRACTVQKCVRAGGKHNDLDNVGYTARHHTFFEMLGNFSFGDYFKKDAIRWAWEYVTQCLGLPPELLAVTVFKGEEGIEADDEAFEAWASVGVPRNRIHRLGLGDNFWAMGDVGPCGPCSEIYFYVPGTQPKATDLPGESDNWLEIWNLVFMQFERKTKDSPLTLLPKPSIDTGAGLERLAAVAQKKASNYDTDVFVPLLGKISKLSQKRYGETEADDASMRILADHARATAFLMADGVLPSNEGRGYVLRRIVRRAIRHAERLGLKTLVFHQVVEKVVELMGEVYPELQENRTLLTEATRHEEDAFRNTLEKGLRKIDEELEVLQKNGQNTLSGKTLFFLHDTHGFPWDLTQTIARERGFKVDIAGWEKEMEKQRSRTGFSGSGETAVQETYLQLAKTLAPTAFVGYEALSCETQIVAILKDNQPVQSASAPDKICLVFAQTPFYGESGGQVGDMGHLESPHAFGHIAQAQRPLPSLVVHPTSLSRGSVKLGDTLTLQVNAQLRKATQANHSATHLMHKALKTVLGSHVKQAGSVVSPEGLRFDYTHFAAPESAQLEAVEDCVNQWICENEATHTQTMSLAQAKAEGAVALFGEKYGETVRVVSVHPKSKELCGGTHTQRTGDIGLFKIVAESSIASGVRRIQALTGAKAFAWLRDAEKELKRAAEIVKAPPRELGARMLHIQKRMREFEKRLEMSLLASQVSTQEATTTLREIAGIRLLVQNLGNVTPKTMRALADKHREELKSGLVALTGTTPDNKAVVLLAATPDVVAKGVKAAELIKGMAEAMGGTGGGKAELAQAGAADASRLWAALEKLEQLLKSSNS
ncbi:MAG: alanine--tRNA ligase [Cystobacterineae bacterium]|nr:alanine--tRNA ligase [Cystobacterineae bacterium]